MAFSFKRYILSAWLFSVLVMTAVDFVIGEKAEFINALSVWQRLFGVEVSSGNSLVYTNVGAVGEFVLVAAINFVFACVISFGCCRVLHKQ